MNYPSIEDRVKKGAALLDEKVPGWVERIDLSKFDVGSGFSCVLGQVFADGRKYSIGFMVGLDVLGLLNDPYADTSTVLNGFFWRVLFSLEYSKSPDYPHLGNVWHELINRRQIHNRIANRAYEISQSPECSSQDDNWFRAIGELGL